MLTCEELRALALDPSVPQQEVAAHLTADRTASGPFDPRVVPDPSRVLLDPEARRALELEPGLEAGLDWANALARERRHVRFEDRLAAGDHGPVLVSEGDSWFQFPFLLEDVVDHLDEDHLVWSLDAAGDTVQNIVLDNPEYLTGLQQQVPNGVAAFLFSAAGNDVIGQDASGESALKRLVKAAEPGRDAAWHVDHEALGSVMAFLADAYRQVVTSIRGEPALASLPILVHGYDYPIPGGFPGDPRNPVWASPGQWLGVPLAEKGVTDPDLQRAILRILIDAVYDMLEEVAGDTATTGVHVVDVRGTLPEVGDWADEIHPTDTGFGRVAARFREVLRTAGVGPATTPP